MDASLRACCRSAFLKGYFTQCSPGIPQNNEDKAETSFGGERRDGHPQKTSRKFPALFVPFSRFLPHSLFRRICMEIYFDRNGNLTKLSSTTYGHPHFAL